MRYRRYVAWALFLAVLLPAGALAENQRKYRIVVNTGNQMESVSLKELSKIFLKTTQTWADGSEITPIDLDLESPVRKAFTKDVHDREPKEIKAYWLSQIYSGKEAPPVETSSMSDVLAIVKSLPGAIGYVDTEIALVDGVKVIRIRE